MICPKCKKEIPDNSLKCEHCNARVGSICKNCNTYNHIYNVRCVNCNSELIKFCPSCKSVNLPDALKCRKCGYIFQLSEDEYTEKLEGVEIDNSLEASNLVKSYSQQAAKEILQKAILSQNKKVISLQGENGIGKSIVLKAALNDFSDGIMTWLTGECSYISQLSPCGCVQNLLINFFNVPAFCTDTTQLLRDSREFFTNEFPLLSNDDIVDLVNFLYPQKKDFYENILSNKDKTFALLNKIFKTIIETNKILIILENFDLIDGMSQEFFTNLLNSYANDERVKFLLTYKGKRPVLGCFYSEQLDESKYFDVLLLPLDKGQISIFTDRSFEKGKCPQSVKDKLFLISKGNPAIMEQLVGLLNDYYKVNNSFDIELPSNLINILEKRLEFLKPNDTAYKILCAAVLQGLNFSPVVINEILQMDEVSFVDYLNYLQNLNFIVPVNQNIYAFKNSLLWSKLFEIIKQTEEFKVLSEVTLDYLNEYTPSSSSILGIISQNIDAKEKSFAYWSENTRTASYFGDMNLYIVSQKQCLELLESIDYPQKEHIIKNITERLGKLVSKVNPQEAMPYLSKAIQNSSGDLLKEIELLSYMTECCNKTGNYNGVIECVDTLLSKIDVSNELEIAMIKSRKLKAMLKIGNCGELVNMTDTEILPVLEKYIDMKSHKIVSKAMLCKAWLKTYLALASALILQGNNRAFEVISILFELFERNKITDLKLINKTKLTLALANTLKGDILASQDILSEIIQSPENFDNDIISKWNLVNIFNKFISHQYDNLNQDLFQVVMFANNVNDNFTKNILKTMLGKYLKEHEKAKQAMEIYNQQIAYFSQEKNAIGAMLTWYLVSEVNLILDGPDKAIYVANKALDVAKNPRINNYLFMVLYNKVIAEAEIIKGDYENAKMSIEKAIMFARKFDMKLLLASLYLLYGKYLQDLALAKTDGGETYVSNAFKMYKKAYSIAKDLKSDNLINSVVKSTSALKSFCQLNRIAIK
ncbi:hypothetical protein IJ732_01590 [bacterium]|nr:hypothetical protein [bacterium]